LFANARPFVLALNEFIPILLGFLLGHEFLQWSDIEDHAVVEVLLKIEVRRVTQLVREVAQLETNCSWRSMSFSICLASRPELPAASFRPRNVFRRSSCSQENE
jgi:hypothetical protein